MVRSVEVLESDAELRTIQIVSLLEQVLEEGAPLDSVAPNPEIAAEIVRAYVRDNADISALPELLVYHNSFSLLFNAALEELRVKHREQELFEIVASGEVNWWKTVRQDVPTPKLALRYKDFESILRGMRKLVALSRVAGNESYPSIGEFMENFMRLVAVDEIWIDALEHRISTRDYVHGYEVLAKALRGVRDITPEGKQPAALKEAQDLRFSQYPSGREFQVSDEAAVHMTRRLYESMGLAGLVPPISEGDVDVWLPFVPSCTGKKHLAPRDGLLLAISRFLVQGGSVNTIWEQQLIERSGKRRDEQPWQFTADGARLLSMGCYVRHLKRQSS